MQIEYCSTSIFESRAHTLVNPVNVDGIMGAGLALEFKNRYPDMFFEYKKQCARKKVRIGKPGIWKGEEKWVVNFPTKEHYFSLSKLAEIEVGLKFLSCMYPVWGIESIAFPKLGCGLGGLEWNLVEKVLLLSTESWSIPVFFHI